MEAGQRRGDGIAVGAFSAEIDRVNVAARERVHQPETPRFLELAPGEFGVLAGAGEGPADQHLLRHIGCLRIELDLGRRQAASLELGIDLGHAVGIGGAGLDRDHLARQFGDIGDGGRVGGAKEDSRGSEIGHAVELLLALLGEQHAADHDVAPSGLQRRQQPGEIHHHDRGLGVPGAGERFRDVDIEPARLCRIRGGHELHRREGRIGADGEVAIRHEAGRFGHCALGEAGQQECCKNRRVKGTIRLHGPGSSNGARSPMRARRKAFTRTMSAQARIAVRICTEKLSRTPRGRVR